MPVNYLVTHNYLYIDSNSFFPTSSEEIVKLINSNSGKKIVSFKFPSKRFFLQNPFQCLDYSSDFLQEFYEHLGLDPNFFENLKNQLNLFKTSEEIYYTPSFKFSAGFYRRPEYYIKGAICFDNSKKAYQYNINGRSVWIPLKTLEDLLTLKVGETLEQVDFYLYNYSLSQVSVKRTEAGFKFGPIKSILKLHMIEGMWVHAGLLTYKEENNV